MVIMVQNFGKSDGTENGTEMVKDINPGPAHSFPHNLIVSEPASGGIFTSLRLQARMERNFIILQICIVIQLC